MHGSTRPDIGDMTGAGDMQTLGWRRDVGLWLGVLLAFAATLPVLVAWAPQMTDYPSHLAGYKVMLDHGEDPFLTRYYTFEWEWTGNLGSELLMVPLVSLMGLEAAGKFIAFIIPLLTGLSVLAVARALRGRIGLGAILAFTTIWSPALLMGFLNYSLSLALALFAFAAWVRWENWRWRPAAMVPIAFAVWLCHMSGWGVLGVLVFGYEWSRRSWRDSWKAVLAPWPLIFPLFPMLLGGGGNSRMSYGRQVLEYKWGILYRSLRSHVEWFDLATITVIVALLAIAAATRRIDGRLGWAAVILFVLTLAVPRHIYGGDYADYRLSTAALLVACLAINWPAPRWGLVLVAALFSVRLGITTLHWYDDGRTSQRMLQAMDYVPQGAKVATAVAIPRRQWDFGSFEHLGSYAVVRRSAMENSNFALPGVHLMSMADPEYKRFADPSQRILYAPWQKIDLRRFKPAKKADYLWYIGNVHPVALPDGARILFRTPNSFLARLAKPAKSS
ncbi:hypothetical protein HNO88_002433 [Novosphingobium chloroacetimidivorans]|uniref:Glycosyltransferase RgtA/B/C/D-like domain-containing protein n=1 Tax=Novosphingobium chloroacetimidivorans TaxID=1428314 RepID=A0A7W7KAA3_9SPHN|nr:hypothetical protein [Novosphingobium chloroacetimidivorans]MBB4859107.1 hypothetical protein [Novosphingobium chloroacetimidivorans]